MRPVLVRIPFSHYCHKAEWALTQAGVAYDTWDMSPSASLRLREMTASGTVPALYFDPDTPLVETSDAVAQWAHEHAEPGTVPLTSDALRLDVHRWERWADDVIGPVARREAYRVWYEQPGKLTDRTSVHLFARATRGLALGVLKHTKARRFEDADREAVPEICRRVKAGLEERGTGYLVADHPTIADLSVAALAGPLRAAAPGRNYQTYDGWPELVDLHRRVRPRSLTRVRRHRMTRRRWQALEDAAQ